MTAHRPFRKAVRHARRSSTGHGAAHPNAHRSSPIRRSLIAFDNVRLLRPVPPGVGFALRDRVDGRARGLIVATIYTLREHEDATFAAYFLEVVAPHLAAAGAARMPAAQMTVSASTRPFLRSTPRASQPVTSVAVLTSTPLCSRVFLA